MAQIISVVEGETASFTGQPWPIDGVETRLSTSFNFGTASSSDFLVNNGGYFRVNNYIGDGLGPLLPIIWYIDTVDDDIPEGTETSTITINYEYRASEDAPFISGTFGPITINIIDNDSCDNFFLDYDLDGQQDRFEVVAGRLAQAVSELERLTGVDQGGLIRTEALLDTLQQDFNQLTLEIFGETLSALGAEEAALKVATKSILKNTADADFELAYHITSSILDGSSFAQSGNLSDYIDLGIGLLQFAGRKIGGIGTAFEAGKSIGKIGTVGLWLAANRSVVDRLLVEQSQLSTRIEELEAATEQLRECLDGQSLSSARVAPDEFNPAIAVEPLTVEVGQQTILDFSLADTSATTQIETDSIVLGSRQNDDFFADASVEDAAIDGADGFDYLIVDQSSEAFRATFDDGVALVASSEVSFVTRNVERVAFNDNTLAFDVDGVAGQTYRLYEAAFDRDPDAEGLGFWIDNYDVGNVDLVHMAEFFMQSEEFTRLYGAEESLSDEAFLTLLYANVLDRIPDQAGFDFWSDAQANGVNRAEVLQHFSESVENYANVAGEISDGIWYS